MPRGRRPGSPDTRAAILEIARRRFLADGYQRVTLRSVAAEAGVDLALISYFFGSKKGLFGAALALAVNPAEAAARAMEGELASLPQRVLRTLLTVWDSPEAGPPLLALLRDVVQDEGHAALLRGVVEREIIDRLAARIGGADAHRRAAAFGALLAGVITARYLVRLEPIASMTVDEIVRHLGPSARVALFGPVGAPGKTGGPGRNGVLLSEHP
ncbi:TetR/AcrR family transcriptional regulator [Streptomyces tateyamensis]|uniref:TetR/AcrR family transcriptional regulator n=1 Tax=Streptomyces tateyamensis TaxID=565073 RepID=A0A2V4NPS5_9ACTN|nr:TetR family transcriptional regulator [Streptomyces tateyamensis]PYC87628.1 TetR/AcrR family transcriptional regulator [Streptomyces tateyamensis]